MAPPMGRFGASSGARFGTPGARFGTFGDHLGDPGPPGRANRRQARKRLPKAGSRVLPGTPSGRHMFDIFSNKSNNSCVGVVFVGSLAPVAFWEASSLDFGALGQAKTAIIAEMGIKNHDFQEC